MTISPSTSAEAPDLARCRGAPSYSEPPRGLDALVLDADLRQAVVAVRSLGRAGLSVGAVAPVPRAPAFNSRWCRRSWLVPDPTDGERLRWALLALLEREPAAVIIPLHDGTIEALRAGRAEVASRTAVALAPEPGLGVAVDKERTLEAARGLGLTTPRGALIADPQETAAALGETGLPAVVKPVRSWVASDDGAARLASTAAKDAAAVARAVEAVTAAGGRALVQEWLPGRREAVSLLYAHDRVWARFAQVAHRMAPTLGGSSVLRVSIQPPPDADAAAERLVREVGLEGYSEVEFRRDREGRPALMEVNPRLSASVEVAVRAGVDFPLLLQRWAAGEALRPVAGYRLGVRMRWLGGDLSRLAEAARGQRGPDTPSLGRELAVAVRDTLRPSGYDYVDPGDLRPALVAAGTKLAAYGTRAARRIRGAGNAG